MFAVSVIAGAGHVSAANDEFWKSHFAREDATAQFAFHHGDCDLERTLVGVAFHHHFTRTPPGPVTRTVLFGVDIQEFDCGDQFLSYASGTETFLRPFDIPGSLSATTVDTVIEACVSFPAPGDCFPVDISLTFSGAGTVEVTRDRIHINEPGCMINQQIATSTRQADVSGTISFAPPGGTERSFTVTSDDLAPSGATLSKHSEHSMMKGTTGSCAEQ